MDSSKKLARKSRADGARTAAHRERDRGGPAESTRSTEQPRSTDAVRLAVLLPQVLERYGLLDGTSPPKPPVPERSLPVVLTFSGALPSLPGVAV